MGKFISEYTMTKPFIMIIDDLDKKMKFSNCLLNI
ncbi:hypothetical protein DZC18_000699 [Clostridium beijerinckii]|nr:hypothetical protein [Clostridium beijerinckii]